MLVLTQWAQVMVSPVAAMAAAQAFINNNQQLVNGGDIDLDFISAAQAPLVIQLLALYTQALAAHAPALTSLTTVRYGTTVVTCPLGAVRWTGVTAEEVNWLSSHGTLTNWNTDWTYAGQPWAKPEWNRAAGHALPVSVTTGATISLAVRFDVAPPNASAEYCHVTGLLHGSVVWECIGQFHGGPNVVTINPIVPEPIAVAYLNVAIQWVVRCADTQQFNAGTSTNPVFCLLAAPIIGGAPEDGPTLKRMQAAIQAAGQAQGVSTDISFNIICGLWRRFPNYVLVTDATVPVPYNHPNYFNAPGGAWPIMDYVGAGAECQAIVRFVKGILNQIGSPAQTTGVVIWADPNNPNVAIESALGAITLHNRTVSINGTTWYASLADGPIAAGQAVPQGTRLNNYEACLRYQNGGFVCYFPGGVQAVRPSADAVLRGFSALVWTSTRFDLFGNPVSFCEQIVRTYP